MGAARLWLTMKESGFLAEIITNLPEDVQCPAQVGDAPRGNEPHLWVLDFYRRRPLGQG